jgi:hypothetical protein
MEGDLTNLKGFIERESKILGADAAINLKQDIAASVENTLTIPSLEGMSGSDLSDLAKAMTGFLQELEAGGK